MSDELLKLSVSKCKSFSNCKKQFQFNYILKLPQPDRDYFLFGKYCHLVLETFHQYYIDGCLLPFNIAMKDAWSVAWKKYREKMTEQMRVECWDIINGYLRKISIEKNSGQQLNIIAVEHPFDFHLSENIILRGAIDVLAEDAYDGMLHVMDWKSSKSEKYLVNDFQQLLTYSFVLLRDYPNLTKIRASYVLLRHDFKKLTKEFSLDQILSVKQQYIDYADKIRAEHDFKATPNNLCGFCSFLEHCEEGKDQVSNNSFGQQQKIFGAVNW